LTHVQLAVNNFAFGSIKQVQSAFRISAHPVSEEVTVASDSTQPSGGFSFSDGFLG